MALLKHLPFTNIKTHRTNLIELYTNRLPDANSFMKLVFIEGIRKLTETTIHPIAIENWAIGLEKLWVKSLDRFVL